MKKTVILCIFFLFTLFLSPAPAQTVPTLKDGIGQYQKENYEEAIEALKQVRSKEPRSSQAAFYLGMAYKQVLDYNSSVDNLHDAVTLQPPVKEALLELADALYQLNRLEEAKKWLVEAEKEGFSPARTAFLKGLILLKENKNSQAINAFEEAKKIDPSLAQAAEFQIGISYMKDRNLERAKERFQAAVQRDPLSDMAAFARQYQSMIEKTMYLERPLRLTISAFAGYDSNIVSKPLDAAAAGDITDEAGAFLASSARLDFVPKLNGPWLFNAQYSAVSNVNSRHTHSHDSTSNSITLSPGYNFGNFTVNINGSFTNVLLRTDPDLAPDPDSNPGYKRYLDYATVGPLMRVMFGQNHIGEVFFGYDKKEYYNQKIVSPDADRDAEGFREYISWIWLFRENAFFNLRYDFASEHADGRQWTNNSNRISFNLSLPLLGEEKAGRIGPITMQLTGSALFQDYRYEVDFGITKTTRRDKVYTGSLGLVWKFWKYGSFIVQYTRTQNNSNVPIFEYNRDQYAAGFEFTY